MPSVVDLAGINSISRVIYGNAAGAIAGMVKVDMPVGDNKPLITASMFGSTTTAVDHARGLIEAKGYEVLVFHTIGTGGKIMEGLIADGYIVGSLNMTMTELADYACGGVFSAGPDRCMAASRAGIPAVIVPGCVDMANFGGVETMPIEYHEHNLYKWNPNVTLLRTNVAENIKIGEMIAAAANAATAPVAIVLPLKGVPEANGACFEAIKQNFKAGIPVIELDHNINDPKFSGKVAETLLEMVQ